MMELVERQTLSESVKQGPIPVEQALHLPGKLQQHWTPRMKEAPSIAISSRATSCSRKTKFSTSASLKCRKLPDPRVMKIQIPSFRPQFP